VMRMAGSPADIKNLRSLSGQGTALIGSWIATAEARNRHTAPNVYAESQVRADRFQRLMRQEKTTSRTGQEGSDRHSRNE
jgi:hypothetical protein